MFQMALRAVTFPSRQVTSFWWKPQSGRMTGCDLPAMKRAQNQKKKKRL